MSGRLCRGRGSRDQAVRTRARALLVVGGALGLGGVFAVVAQGATPPAYAATASIAPALYYIGDSTGSNYVFTVKNTGTTTKIGAVEITRPSTYWTVNGCVAPYGWAAQLADTKCRFRASNSSFFIAANGASKNFTVKAKTAAGNVDRVGTWPVIVSASSQFDNTSLLKYASPAGGGLTTKLHTFELITAVVSDTAKTPGTACPAANKDAVVGSQKTIVVCGRNRANVALLPSSAYSSLSGTFVKTAGTFSSGVIQPNSANVVLAQWVNTTVSDVFGSGKKVVTKVGARSDRTSPLRTFTGYNATSSPPVAVDDSGYSVNEDAQLSVPADGVLGNDTDAENDPLTAVDATDPAHGTVALNADGSFTYTPDPDYAGPDSFQYKAYDTHSKSGSATVSITVNPVNDAPVAQPVSASTNEDTAKAVTLSASDVDGDSLSYAIVTGPGHGWLGVISGDSVTYTPDPNYFGGDSFQYKATDGTADSAPVTVTLTVTSVNDVPVADDEAYATDEDTQLAVTAPGVLDGDTDVESSPLTAVLVSGPSHGSLTLNANGSFTYTPAANYFGADSFKYKANDGTADSAVATVAITVGSVNDAPVAQPVSASTNEDTAKAVTFSASDVDGDSLSYAIVTGPGHGWLGAISGNSVTYTPDPNYFGGDSFQYKATDGTADSAPVTVTLTVTSVNDAPVAGDDAYQVIQGNALVVSAPGVLANDTDVDAGATKTALNASTPAHGGVTLNEDGSFTYTPVTTYTGPDSFTYDVSDGTATDTATVSLTVVPPNATPTADATSASGNEDAGAITVTLTGHDSDDDNLTFAVSSPVGGTLGTPAAPADCTTTALTCTTTVTFTPAADFNGAGSFSYTVYDGTISSAPAGATVTVNPVNDAPSFTAGAGQTVNEDAAAQTVTGWATGVSAGPANESAQTVSFTVTNDDNSLFATQPAVSPTGTLTYLPASDANGVATVSVKITDDGGNANGGVAESAVQTFTITVTAVNDAPSFLKGDDQTVLEDSGTYSVSNWASAISKGPADESGQALTFDVDVDTPALFLAQPTLSDTGTLQYTLAADAVGTATVTVTLSDNGGVLNGGDDTSDAQTFTITITPVNDAPSFTTAGSQSVLEDAAAQTVNGFVTSTSAGPADEAGQTVTVAVTNVTNPTMFAVQPTITNGTLTYTPAANANGVSTVTVSATDDGGIANGGDATSDNQTFAITVTAVNDAPSFVKGLDETVLEDAGTQSVSNWATSISAGPANENTQTVAFTVTNNNNGLFLTQPTISPTGTLVYAAAANKYGTATVTVVLKDSGGTANSGVDTAPTQTFVITVNPVNDPPSAIDQSFSVQTNMKISLSGLFTGATDTADTDQQPGYTPQYSVGTITATGANCPGCVVSGVNNALGTFDFEPPPGQTGTFTLKYTIVDSGYPTPGVESAQKTLTFTVSGDVIWFADATSGDDVTGNGTLARPFKTLTAVAGVDATNHKVFVHPGTYSTAFTLNAGEWLTGAGTKAASFDALMGITPPAGTIARPSINGTNPTVSGAVTLGSGNTLRGVDLTGATALSGSNFGTLTLGSGLSTDVRLNSTGQALNLNTGTISGDLLSTTSTGSAADNVNLTTVSTTGTSLGTGALSGATGDALEINGGTGSFSYAGTVTNTSAGRAVAILNKTGTSTVALSGAVNDNSGAGVAMTGNSSGTTVSLTGGVVLSSGTQPAFVATGAGTVSVTGATNTITSTTGTPLNITNVSIGAADVTFQSISANGAASGIVLDNTGSAGNFALTGTGTTAGSGGTIQNGTGGDLTSNQCAAVSSTAGTGIFLRNTRDASLKNMNLSNFSNFAVLGYDVTNLTMDRFSVTGTNGSNSSQDEDSVHFCNLLGSATISNSTINGGFENSLRVYNTSGTLNRLTVSATTLATRSATTDADDAFLATAFNTATMNVTLSNVTATTARGDLVQYALGDNSTGDLVIQNSTFTNNHPAMLGGGGGVTLGAGSASTSVSTNFTYSVTNNSFRDAVGNGLTLFLGNGTASGTIASNTFGVSGVQKSAGAASGIAVTKIKGGTGKVSILNNTIRSYGADAGIRVLANDGNPTLRATITGNSVTEPSTAAGSPSFAGITVEPGATGTDNVTMCLDLGGAGALQNSVSNGDPSNFNDINLPLNGNTTVDLPGYAGGTTDTTAVGNYLKARNSGDGTPTVFVSNSFVGTSSFTHVASNCL
ncbi:MAG TPA: Ig-like domain-containing protein [Mycobacteriales bacterium]